jgi:hypothetical protein
MQQALQQAGGIAHAARTQLRVENSIGKGIAD